MAACEVKVLNTWVSMFGLRVLIALKHKDVEYEYQEENLRDKSQLLLESNPVHKKIPVLIHSGKPVCESLIIVQYIDEAWPSSDKPPLLPKDPFDRAVARFWADYIDKKMYDAGSRIVRCPPGEQREQAKKDLIEALQTLDGALRDMSKGGAYFGGSDLGYVDVALAPFLCWFEAYETMGEFKIWESCDCPHLSKWAKDVLEHPSVKGAVTIAPSAKVVDFAHILRQRYGGA